MYINKAIVFGNLTRDPELKTLPSGMLVCSVSLATNRTWTDKEGKKNETVDYHNVTMFSKTAENVAKYMNKGSSMFVEGRLETRSWEKDGVKHYRTEIIAESVQFGPKKDAQAPIDKSGSALPDYTEGEDVKPEDIPF